MEDLVNAVESVISEKVSPNELMKFQKSLQSQVDEMRQELKNNGESVRYHVQVRDLQKLIQGFMKKAK